MKKILETLKRKWAEYLLEIIVIMIGVLGAFSLNNWKESWSTKMQEIELLTSIHKEFTLNRNELNRSIEKAQNIQEKCEALLAHTGNHEMKLSRLESDSLIDTGLTNIITFDVIVNDEIKLGFET